MVGCQARGTGACISTRQGTCEHRIETRFHGPVRPVEPVNPVKARESRGGPSNP